MRKTIRILFMLGFVSLSVGVFAKPNVLFVFVDDQGYYDLSCYGATEVKTTRIDRLAEEGVRFTDYYSAAPICSPSRAGLLTGCYPRRVGNHIWVHRPDSTYGIHPDELTIAELFKNNGYATACIGKWHLGFEKPLLPKYQGFDHYFGLLHNLDKFETVHFDDEGGIPIMRNDKVFQRPADPAKLTRLYTDEAIGWMKKQTKADKPFFLYLPHTMLHTPLGASDRFKGSSDWGEYGDAIHEMDFHVGRLMDTLKALGIEDNTLVIYASDNGRGPGRNPDQPISGSKLTTWEGGLRVPCIAWGPGLGIEEGVTTSVMAHAMDWYPTLASIAGIKVPEGRIIDGRDMSHLLQGKSDVIEISAQGGPLNADVPLRRYWNPGKDWVDSISRDEYLNAFFYHGSAGAFSAVRSGKWKLHLNPDLRLYNLETDPGEKKPVRDGKMTWTLRGMAALFQEEMRLFSRPAGEAQSIVLSNQGVELEEHKDLTYYQDGDVFLQLDLYRPKGVEGPLPTVVCIHGGGWHKGSRQGFSKVARALAKQGFCTATISYRLSGVEPFPAQIQDCKSAVRWLRKNAAKYGIDPDRIGAIGHSAGGHLAALLATSEGCEKIDADAGSKHSCGISAAVAMGAQTDLMSERNKEISASEEKGEIWKKFLGGTQVEKPENYKLASPLSHLDAGDPPIAFITGELDSPSTRAGAFSEKAATLGVKTDIMIVDEQGHNFFREADTFDMTINRAAAFLRDNL
ncbi:MAG: alpha/beta fold hydrolase [Puniceicoccaceae bacterium]